MVPVAPRRYLPTATARRGASRGRGAPGQARQLARALDEDLEGCILERAVLHEERLSLEQGLARSIEGRDAERADVGALLVAERDVSAGRAVRASSETLPWKSTCSTTSDVGAGARENASSSSPVVRVMVASGASVHEAVLAPPTRARRTHALLITTPSPRMLREYHEARETSAKLPRTGQRR